MDIATPTEARLLSDYPHHYRQDTEFGDLDALGHVNNLAIGRFYENARVRLMQMAIMGNTQFAGSEAPAAVLVKLEITYLKEVRFPDQLMIGSAVSHIGNTSFRLQQGLYRNDSCVGFSESVLVHTSGGQPHTISSTLREIMQGFMIAR